MEKKKLIIITILIITIIASAGTTIMFLSNPIFSDIMVLVGIVVSGAFLFMKSFGNKYFIDKTVKKMTDEEKKRDIGHKILFNSIYGAFAIVIGFLVLFSVALEFNLLPGWVFAVFLFGFGSLLLSASLMLYKYPDMLDDNVPKKLY